MVDGEVFQMHSIFGDDIIDTNIHQGLLVLLYIAVESEISKLFYKVYQVFAMFLLCIVEVDDGGSGSTSDRTWLPSRPNLG